MLDSLEEQKKNQQLQDKKSEEKLAEQHSLMDRTMDQAYLDQVQGLKQIMDANQQLLTQNVPALDTQTFHAPGEKSKLIRSKRKPILEKEQKRKEQREQKRFEKEKTKAVKALDAQANSLEDLVEKKISTEELSYFHQETLEKTLVTLSMSHQLEDKTRTDLIKSGQTLSDQSAKLYSRFVRTKTVLTSLENGDPQLKEFFTQRLEGLQKEKAALDVQMERFTTELKEQNLNHVANKEQHERFLDRRNHYADVHQCSRQEATDAVIQRFFTPATLEPYQAHEDQYRNAKNHIIISKEVMRLAYKGRIEDMVASLRKDGDDRYIASTAKMEQRVHQYLDKLIEHNDFRFRCGADVFGLFADDKLKNQMETKSSKGTLNIDKRVNFSLGSFGVEKDSITASEYENYGYLGSSDPQLQCNSITSNYGCVSVVLNKERMKGRVTCAFGDSLANQNDICPQLLDHADLCCVGQNYRAKLLKKATDDLNDANGDDDYAVEKVVNECGEMAKYLELQFHGDVTIRDVDELNIVHPKLAVEYPEELPEEEHEAFRQEKLAEYAKQCAEDIAKVAKKIKEINRDPGSYGREGLPPLKLKIVTDNGNGAKVCDYDLKEKHA